LLASNLDASRRFYGGLFGWNAEEPEAEFGG
jgi:predicted enzyme related to lactoylglutathione lyase